MNRRNKLLEEWASDSELTLEEMYDKCDEYGWCDFFVEKEERIRDIISDYVKRGIVCSPLLKSIEENLSADVFVFDVTGWSNNPAKPIYTKKELAEALGV